MTADELNKLIQQRQRANELAYTGDPDKSAGYAALVRTLDEEIAIGRAQVRQAAAEDAVKKKLRLVYAGDDASFESIWLVNKDAFMLDDMKSQAARAEQEAREQAQRMVSG